MTDTIPSLVLAAGERLGAAPAYHQRPTGAGAPPLGEGSRASWRATSWREYAAEVRSVGAALVALGVGAGEPVAILAGNRPEWTIFDVAAMAAGAIPAGIYATSSAEECAAVLAHCGAPVLLVDSLAQFEKIDAVRSRLGRLRHVVMAGEGPPVDDPLVVSWSELVKAGDGDEGAGRRLEERLGALTDDALATLIYTSGTTGAPKGVMLTHDNLTWTARGLARLIAAGPADRAVSYLPLSHIAEQMFTVHGPAVSGTSVWYCEAVDRLLPTLLEVRPTLFFGVPRVWEKFAAGIAAKLAGGPGGADAGTADAGTADAGTSGTAGTARTGTGGTADAGDADAGTSATAGTARAGTGGTADAGGADAGTADAAKGAGPAGRAGLRSLAGAVASVNRAAKASRSLGGAVASVTRAAKAGRHQVEAAVVAKAQVAGLSVARARNEGAEPAGPAAALHRVYGKVVYGKVRAGLGLDEARLCASGAAPLALEVITYLAGFGIPVHEAYGLSECSGPATFNIPGRARFGVAGPAFPGVELATAEDGEVLVRGRNVFSGYWDDADATADALVDGWLHTGDLGTLDEAGFLRITGRKKDIIVTAGGQNVAPAPIETALRRHPLVSEAVVIGDRRPYLVALISLDPELAGAPGAGPADPAARAELAQAVDGVNADLAPVEQVKRFAVLPRALSMAEGELTGTLKVRRAVVTEHFAAEIAALYDA